MSRISWNSRDTSRRRKAETARQAVEVDFMPLATIEEALADIRAGKMLIVMDDEDRENEGDLTMAAQLATPEAINFMSKYGRGLICVSVVGKRLDDLHLPMMVNENTSRFETAFTVSIEAKGRRTTGISAHGR